jgi:hypothetical protein
LRNLERIEVYNLKNYLPYFTLEMCGLNQDEFRRERKDFRKQLKELKSELPSASIMSKFEAVVKTCIIEDDNNSRLYEASLMKELNRNLAFSSE